MSYNSGSNRAHNFNSVLHSVQLLLLSHSIALFMVSFSHLHYNVIQLWCKTISKLKLQIARNCLTDTLDFIVMQISRVNHEKGYFNLRRSIYPFIKWSGKENQTHKLAIEECNKKWGLCITWPMCVCCSCLLSYIPLSIAMITSFSSFIPDGFSACKKTNRNLVTHTQAGMPAVTI